jgi:hypothetical protein
MNFQHETESMMKQIVFCLAALMMVVLLVMPALAATKVFLLGGQSNMAGVGGYAGYIPLGTYPWTTYPYGQGADDPCPAPYNTPQSAVKFWNYNTDSIVDHVHNPGTGTGWMNLQNGYGYRNDQFGPELSFGYRLHQLYPDDEIYLVKYGITSTSLAGNWNPDGSGTSYNNFKARVTAALQNLTADGKIPTIAGMIWMQGEDDSTVHANALAYQQNLQNFITHVRNDFINAQNLKFVTGRITYMTQVWAPISDINAVRSAQQNVPSLVGNASWINTDDLEWAYYGHYGTQGQIDLGNRFANEFTPVPEPSTLVLAGTGLALVLPGLLRYARRKRR